MILTIQIIGAVLIFGILVFVHELGHFLAAKKFGVMVHEFAIGMGPIIWKKQSSKDETLYSIRCIPLGGFCKMEGEDEESDDARSFTKITWWKKIIVLAAGGVFNLIMGLLLCIVMGFASGAIPVAKVAKSTNPQLLQGDIILSIDNKKVYYSKDIEEYMMSVLKSEKTREFNVTINRNGKVTQKNIKASYNEDYGRYMLGYEADYENVGFLSGLQYGFYDFWWWTKLTISNLVGLITGKISANLLSGPVGIFGTLGGVVGEVAKGTSYAWEMLSSLFLQLTLGLGILNLIPFPALDGGRIVFVLVQAVSRKKISAEKEGWIHLIGLTLLIGLVLFATYNDILRLIAK